jgi:ubiquinone/menaquinone biosynthesis C-methylase UbiE
MTEKGQVLSPAAAQAYYDKFGKKQDSQGFYEDPPLAELIAHADFPAARSVFEFGCGTGKLAVRLLEKHLSPSAGYSGCDISPVMISLAEQRLAPYAGRAGVALSGPGVQFALPDHSVDRIISSYVLDLLSVEDIRRFFAEAQRTLTPQGRLCLVSLTRGVNFPSRIVSSLWTVLFNLRPAIVGGCRPIHPEAFIEAGRWRVVHRRVLAPFAVPSEVLVLDKADIPGNEPETAAPGAPGD